MRARLVIVRGEGTGSSYELYPEEPVSLGRSRDCDLVLHDEHASRHHAQVRCQDGRWLLRDLVTRNGTWVDGVRVAGEVELPDGCEIAIADMRLRFVLAAVVVIPPEDAAGKPAAAAQGNIPNLPAANGPAPGEAKGPRKGPVFPAGDGCDPGKVEAPA